MNHPSVAAEITDEYINYYGFVLKHLNTVKIIHFDQFVKNEKKVLKNIGEFTNHSPQINLNESIEGFISFDDFLIDYKNRMRNFEEVQNSDLSCMPNNDRKNFKTEYMDIILNSSNYFIALSLYNDIILSKSVL